MKVLFATPFLDLIFLLVVTTTTVTEVVSSSSGAGDVAQQQCNGVPPQPDMINFLGTTLEYEVADRICCHNHRYAEAKGLLSQPQVALFDKLNPDVETIFYDVVCGLPLFIAPRGRSFEDFKEESVYHGWPSFRPEEMISENVILHDDGRMESVCLTHLGHNLPESGVDRYCIDLVCIAGSPLNVSDGNLTKQFPSISLMLLEEEEEAALTELIGTSTSSTTNSGVVTSDVLLEDPDNYVSSAEQNSGKVSNKKRNNIIYICVGVLCIVSFIAWCFYTNISRNNARFREMENLGGDDKDNDDDEENNNKNKSTTSTTNDVVEEETKTTGDSVSTTD